MEHKKKLSGIGFWMVVGAAVIKDVFDIVAAFIILVPVVGLLAAALIYVFITIPVSLLIFLYLLMSGVRFTTKKLAVSLAYGFIELTPLGALPTAAITLFIIRYLENNELARKVARRKAVLREKAA